MRGQRRKYADADRATAAAAVLFFVGLTLVTALLAGGFWVLASGPGDDGDPTQVEIASSTCAVVTDDDETGVGDATLTVRYRGNGTVDLSDATVTYSDDDHETQLAVGPEATATTFRVANDTGAFDPSIGEGESRKLVVAVDEIRGRPLLSAQRATFELSLGSGTVSTASIRVPGGTSESQSYVDC